MSSRINQECMDMKTIWILILLCAGTVASGTALAEESLESRFAEMEGVRIHYTAGGEGPVALVFVHGWSCDRTVWRFQVAGFRDQARLVVIDLPGHGKSDKPEIRYTMDYFARSVDAVMRSAGVERAVLVGHSNGTPVVRQFYRLFPKKTQALVIVDGALRPFVTDPSAVEGLLAPLRGEKYLDFAKQFISDMLPPDEELRSSVRDMMLSTPQHVMVSSLETSFDPAIWKKDPIEVPTLSILAQSPFWNEEYEALVRRIAPKVDYQIVEGVSHFLMMEEKSAFNQRLGSFLVKNGFLETTD